MATEWFVETNEQVTGPFTVGQLKAQAAAKRIEPETRIRRGRRGRWHKAKNVKGLLDDAETVRKATPSLKNEQADSNNSTCLAPLFNRKRRAIIWVCLIGFILIGKAPIYQQAFFDLTMGLIIGSFPITEVKKKAIQQTLFVLFIPVHVHIWKLHDYHAVEAHLDKRAGEQFGAVVYFVFWYTLLWRFFDFLMPWLGGGYQLYLKDYADERTLVWQGSNARDYEANLELISSRGLRIS